MESTNCPACGSDLLDPEARFCSACGASAPVPESVLDGDRVGASDPAPLADVPEEGDPVIDDGVHAESDPDSEVEATSNGLSKYSLEVPMRRRLTEEQWQYATWGAIAAGIVAIVALLAVVFGLLSRSDDAVASPIVSGTTPTTTTVERRTGMITEFPVTYPSVVESPQIGDSAGYHQDGAFIAVRLTVDTCERSDGMLRAGGSIRNETRIGQTLDYHIAVKMTRRVVGTSLASLETTVEDLGPHETAVWSVEAVSTKTVNVACNVATLTVAPSEGP
jgi:hypothetical protein